MIGNIYITRIENSSVGKAFGFAETPLGENVYIPGRVVEAYELNSNDEGTKNKVSLIPDASKRAEYIVTAFILEDNLLEQRLEHAKDEIEYLKGLLTKHGIKSEG